MNKSKYLTQFPLIMPPKTYPYSESKGQTAVSKKNSERCSKASKADQVCLTYKNIRTLIDSLRTHRVNTLTELCRIERVAAACESEEDARAFQEPMTTAWQYYVNSNQMLSELRGLTTQYPFCGDIVTEARYLVDNDPESNRSWNYAWLVLNKIRDEYVLIFFVFLFSYRQNQLSLQGGFYPMIFRLSLSFFFNL